MKQPRLSARYILALALLPGFMASCASLGTSPSRPEGRWALESAWIDGQSWVLDPAAPESGEPPAYTLVFDGERISGRGSCNSWFGRVNRVQGPLIDLEAQGSTKMFCLDETGPGETRWFQALDKVDRWTQDGDTLVLLGPEGLRLELVRLPPQP